jgi:hypothetical protein
MPEGYYGEFTKKGKVHTVVFFSTFKSECLRMAKIYRGEGSNARVIRWPIKMGTLAGGAVAEQWAVAISRKGAMRRHEEDIRPFG